MLSGAARPIEASLATKQAGLDTVLGISVGEQSRIERYIMAETRMTATSRTLYSSDKSADAHIYARFYCVSNPRSRKR